MKIPAQHSDKVKIVIGLLVFFIPVILYSIQIPFYQNCINAPKWLLIFAACGAALGLAIGLYIVWQKENDFQKLQIGIASVIIGILVTPLLLTLLNRIPLLQQSDQVEVEVISVEAFEQSRFGNLDMGLAPDGFFVHCLHGSEILRLQSGSAAELEGIEQGHQLNIILHKGPIGLRWAELPEQ